MLLIQYLLLYLYVIVRLSRFAGFSSTHANNHSHPSGCLRLLAQTLANIKMQYIWFFLKKSG